VGRVTETDSRAAGTGWWHRVQVLHRQQVRRTARATGPVDGPTVFVLGGGGAFGAVQAGQLVALLEAGLRPDALVGTSVGALNAAFLAVRPDADRARELAALWCGDEPAQVFATPAWRRAYNVARAAVRRCDHLLEPDALAALIRRWVPVADLAELAVPLQVVTTCLETGGACYHAAGDPVAVLSASAALPGLLPPVRLAGGLHVDGGVVDHLPVAAGLRLLGDGGGRLVVLDTGSTLPRADAGHAAPAAHPAHLGALDVLLASFAATRRQLQQDLAAAVACDPRVTVLPTPAALFEAGELAALPADPRDFHLGAALAAAGRASTARLLAGGVLSPGRALVG
jgi:predicted acylesterase/phospholipase RssA